MCLWGTEISKLWLHLCWIHVQINLNAYGYYEHFHPQYTQYIHNEFVHWKVGKINFSGSSTNGDNYDHINNHHLEIKMNQFYWVPIWNAIGLEEHWQYVQLFIVDNNVCIRNSLYWFELLQMLNILLHDTNHPDNTAHDGTD